MIRFDGAESYSRDRVRGVSHLFTNEDPDMYVESTFGTSLHIQALISPR